MIFLHKEATMKSRSLAALVFLIGALVPGLLFWGAACGMKSDSDGNDSDDGDQKLPAVELLYTEEFELAGYRENTPIDAASFYRPVAPDGFHVLGYYGQQGHGAPCGWMFVARELKPGALAEPLDYEVIGQPSSGCTFWKPIPPPGYVGLGFVAQTGLQKPDTDEIR